jgi:NAD(P)-dependent dehydrogenase (short-subunit alcohol dehydrogenase family)
MSNDPLGPEAAALGFEAFEESRVSAKKVALVTGGSSGIGEAISLLLANRGFRVFAASRHAERLRAKHDLLQPLNLDVTDDRSVAKAVATVLEDSGRLDLVVNGAGYALIGALEDTSIAEAREQFETNFFGALRVIQAILPVMRHQRRGRIVNVSSVLGFLPAPYMGIYAASKHALEGYTETLDHEVRELGIRAVLVQPYFTKTALGANGHAASTSLNAYREQRAQSIAAIERSVAQGEDPRAVAEVVWQAATAERPRLHYAVGRTARLATLRRFVPAQLFDRSLRQQFGMRSQ